MIKANELRIGNNIYDECGHVIKMTIAHFDFIDFIEHNPIPLTEEWLIKFGFENRLGFLSLGALSCVYSYEENVFYFYIGKDGDNDIKVMFVHQLQNLYFALTGQELQIKE